jgi:hypothetical protein
LRRLYIRKMKTMLPDRKSPARVNLISLKKFSAVVVLTATAVVGLTACGSMSDSTKDQGKTVICAAGSGIAAQIKTGGAVGKFAAGVVRDNSKGEIKALAERAASGQGDVQASQELGNHVENLCKK